MTPRTSLVVAITGAVIAWNGVAAPAAAAPCQPAVSVKGDDEDVARIARALSRYQVAGQSTSGRAAWQVTASRASGQLALQIDDGHGLTLVRRVTSPAAAAAVIDSWVHRDLATASAAGGCSDSRAAPQHGVVARARRPRTFVISAHASETVPNGGSAATSAEPSPASEAAAPADKGEDKEPATTPPRVERTQAVDTEPPVINRAVPALAVAARRGPVSVGLGAEASFGNDRSVWWGGHISGCLAVGSFCVGLLARGDTTALNAVGEPGTVKRRGADGLAFIGLPIALGRMTLLPEVGLGVGVRRSTVSLQNTDPAEPPTANGDNPAGNWTLGIRSMTRATLLIPVWGRLAFDVTGSIDGSFANRFHSTDGDGAIPGEPNVFLRGGVALRYGTP